MRKKSTARTKPQRVHLHAYERLLAICAEIQKGDYPSKAALAGLRDVERTPRTIQRDLQALRRLKAPLAYSRKAKGFYFTDPDWRLPKINLTKGELLSFFTAERILRRLGNTTEVRLARDAVRSLAALLPEEVEVDLEALESAISFAPEPALDASPDILRKLTEAAAHQQTLHIEYYSQHSNKQSERDVDVLKVYNHLGEWYAVCYDHLRGETRDFHAGRISALSKTRRVFKPPKNWDAEKYLRSGFGMFRGGKAVEVAIEFDAYQARYARERTYHPTQKNKELGNGRLQVTFQTTEAALEQVARWLMQYGSHAKAVAPEKLRKLVAYEIEVMRVMYTNH
ncbi:MAG: WYL domain-containing protein [Acidobacteriota bacterium]